ncbi:tRNA:m(4)X modification enzyme TRM13 homolog isoform 1-T2 [Theristicus caerulescens]
MEKMKSLHQNALGMIRQRWLLTILLIMKATKTARMSSWATCGMRETTTKASTSEENKDQTNDTEEHEQTSSKTESGSDTLQGILTVEERKDIGCLCKLLIDHGRIEYLQQRGYKAALQYYTESAVSLENVLLTAVPSPSLISEPTT